MNSFTTRFIIRSTVVIFIIFLTIYILFNRAASDFIRNTADAYLTLQIRNTDAQLLTFYNRGWRRETSIEFITNHFLDLPEDITTLDSLAFAILSDNVIDNYIIINHRNEIVIPEEGAIYKSNILATYYMENQELFEIGETIIVEISDIPNIDIEGIEGRIFYLRSIATNYVKEFDEESGEFQIIGVFPEPPYPLTILLYTEVTEMVAFQTTINQILLIALSISGLIILTMTAMMSSKFKQSIKKLADYAEEIGHGSFDAEIEKFKYSEFQILAKSMTDMSNMLEAFEVNQKAFFQNASHELRTPLMAIQCYSEGILADVFEPDDAANIINHEIEKMTELVNSILYLSRISHQTSQMKSIGVNEFLTNCYNQIKILADNNNKTIRLDTLEDDLEINIDYQLFERAVLNILTNALRYAKTEITITTTKHIKRDIFANIKQDMLHINIANDGEKIAEKDLPYLFERFYKGSGGNTGLGLAITKEIITAAGGDVTVKNLEDRVCFRIELPVRFMH